MTKDKTQNAGVATDSLHELVQCRFCTREMTQIPSDSVTDTEDYFECLCGYSCDAKLHDDGRLIPDHSKGH